MTIRLLTLLSFFGMACTGNGPGGKDNPDDTSIEPDDTGEIEYEEGCIVLDGGQTFAWMEDALKVAGEGSTVSLEDCGTTFDQQAIVTKGVSIVGPGVGVMVWNAPVNKAAIEVSGADGASIEGFTFTSTRDGILIESSTGTQLTNLEFIEIANTAVVANNSQGTTVSNSVFQAPKYGAVQVDNGTATVDGNTVTNSLGFGFRSTDGAVITASNNVVSGTLYTSLDNGLIDGFGLWGDGGSFVSSSNELTDNVIAVLVDEGDIDSTDDVISGGLYGIYGVFGEFYVTGAQVTNAIQFAIVLVTQNDPVTLTNSTVYGDPEVVFMQDDPEAWGDANAGSIVLQSDDVITVEGLELEGYNAQGLTLQDYSTGGEAYLTDVQIISPGRYGIVISDMDAVLTDVTVDDLRLVDDPTLVNQDYYFSVGYGLLIVSSDVEWNGGGVSNSVPINMVAQSSSLNFDGITVTGGEVLSLWSINSSLVLTNSTVTDAPGFGGIANYSGDLVLDSNTFIDNLKTTYTIDEGRNLQYLSSGPGGTWTSGSGTFTDDTATFISDGYQAGDVILPLNYGYYVDILSVDSETELTLDVTFPSSGSDSYWYGYHVLSTYTQETYSYFNSLDVVGSSASSMSITNNTFTNGSEGLYIDGGDVVIEDNIWTNYNGSPIRLVGVTSTAELKDNTFYQSGEDALYCSGSALEVDGLTIDGVEGTEYQYERWRDGTLDYSYSTTYTGPAAAFYDCTVTLDGVTISGANERSIYASDTSLELYELNISEDPNAENLGYGVVLLNWSGIEPYLLASEVTITSDSMGDVMSLYNSNASAGQIYLEDLTVVGGSANGLVLDGVTAEFVNLRADSMTDNGIQSIGSELSIDGGSMSTHGCAGISAQGDDAQSLDYGYNGAVSNGNTTFTAVGGDFQTLGLVAGDLIVISDLRSCPFVIASVDDADTLTLTSPVGSDGTNLSYQVMTAGTAPGVTVTLNDLSSNDSTYGLYLDTVTAELTDVTTGGNDWGISCGASTTTTCSNVSSTGDSVGADYGCCP